MVDTTTLFKPILPRLDMDTMEARQYLFPDYDSIQFVYRPPAGYDPVQAKAADDAARKARFPNLLIGGGGSPLSYYQQNPQYMYHPTTGETKNKYNERLNKAALDAIFGERDRYKRVNEFLSSPEGQRFVVKTQRDIINGNPVDPNVLKGIPRLLESFSVGLTAPTINDPYQGKAWQDAYNAYYQQFIPVGKVDEQKYMPPLFGASGPRRSYWGIGSLLPQTYLDAVKDDPELYKFAQDYNKAVNEASVWTQKIQNPYGLFYDVTPQGYVAPVRNQTVKYGATFGGTAGAGGIGSTNNNPVPIDQPGAGLWVMGIDPNNPADIARAYENLFFLGSDVGAQEALASFKPKRNADGSWQKFTNINDLYSFASELDKYYRTTAAKIDLPKRGILNSLPGQLIAGLITGAMGNLSPILGGLTGAGLSAAAGGNPILGGLGGFFGALAPAGPSLNEALGVSGIQGIPAALASTLPGAIATQLQSPFFWLDKAAGILLTDKGDILKVPPGSLTPPTTPVTPTTPTTPVVPTLPTGVAPTTPDTPTPVTPTTAEPVSEAERYFSNLLGGTTPAADAAQKKFGSVGALSTMGSSQPWNFQGTDVSPLPTTAPAATAAEQYFSNLLGGTTPAADAAQKKFDSVAGLSNMGNNQPWNFTGVAPATPARPVAPVIPDALRAKQNLLPRPTAPRPVMPPAVAARFRAPQIPANIRNKLQPMPLPRGIISNNAGPMIAPKQGLISNNAASMIATPTPRPNIPPNIAAKLNRLPRP